MFKPVEMKKIVLLATKDAEAKLISLLHVMGVIEIRPFVVQGLEQEKPLEIYDEVSKELVRVRALISVFRTLGFPKQTKVDNSDMISANSLDFEQEDFDVLSEAKKIVIDAELKELIDKRNENISKLAEYKRKKTGLEKIVLFPDIDFTKLKTKNFTFVIGTITEKSFKDFKKDSEEYLAGDGEIINHKFEKNLETVLIFYPRKENIDFLLSRYGFEKIELPDEFSTYAQGMEAFEKKVANIEKEIEEIENKLTELCELNFEKLLLLESKLFILSERAAIAMKFASGKKIIAIQGWIKKRDVSNLKERLEKDFPNNAELIESKKQHDENDTPIALDNPKNIKQFQWLVEFYSLPKYYELDPTFILLFTVPIIYGMIVGDVGYGIISIFLSLLILRKYTKGLLSSIAKIWLFSAFSAIVFGLVFDEWFGFSHVQFAEWLAEWGINLGITHALYEGISRRHHLDLVLGLTIIVGLFQLTLGYILGIINTWNHDRKHAYAKIGWLMILLGGAFAVSSFMFNLIPHELGNIAALFFGAGTIAVIYFEGFTSIFEIPGLAANTLSYARIAAAGVVGVILAEIINKMFLPTPNSIILFPLFVILHLLNAGLAMFESIVQGGRLNLVEFYSKFFHGGGRPFKPFAMENISNEK